MRSCLNERGQRNCPAARPARARFFAAQNFPVSGDRLLRNVRLPSRGSSGRVPLGAELDSSMTTRHGASQTPTSSGKRKCTPRRPNPIDTVIRRNLGVRPRHVQGAWQALEIAEELDDAKSSRSVDAYFRGAMIAWRCLTADLASPSSDDKEDDADDPCAVYNGCVAGLIDAAQRYGRIEGGSQLIIVDQFGKHAIPIEHHGLSWLATDYCEFLPAEDFRSKNLEHHFASGGVGAALIVMRNAPAGQRFMRPQQPFAITAVLRPAPPNGGAARRHSPATRSR